MEPGRSPSPHAQPILQNHTRSLGPNQADPQARDTPLFWTDTVIRGRAAGGGVQWRCTRKHPHFFLSHTGKSPQCSDQHRPSRTISTSLPAWGPAPPAGEAQPGSREHIPPRCRCYYLVDWARPPTQKHQVAVHLLPIEASSGNTCSPEAVGTWGLQGGGGGEEALSELCHLLTPRSCSPGAGSDGRLASQLDACPLSWDGWQTACSSPNCRYPCK